MTELLFIQWNKDSCKYIFIWVCQATGPWLRCMSLCKCLCVWYQIRVLAKKYICQTTFNSIISLVKEHIKCGTITLSPRQQKEQGVGIGSEREWGVRQNLKKGW